MVAGRSTAETTQQHLLTMWQAFVTFFSPHCFYTVGQKQKLKLTSGYVKFGPDFESLFRFKDRNFHLLIVMHFFVV